MRASGVDHNVQMYARRRAQLFDMFEPELRENAVILLTGNFESERELFRQESSFYYLTGLNEPGAVMLCYGNGNDVLYVPQYATARDRWLGEVMTPSVEMAQLVDVDEMRYLGAPRPGYACYPLFEPAWYAELLQDLTAICMQGKTAYVVQGQLSNGHMHQRYLYDRLVQQVAMLATMSRDASDLVAALRCTKQDDEMRLICHAVAITCHAQRAAAQSIVPGKKEHEIQAVLEGMFTMLGAARCAFPSIVATGKNSTVLHYTNRNSTVMHGDLVVVDIGAEFGYYAADITRTYPASGVFTARQKEVYEIVLETQQYVASKAAPGMYLNNPLQPELSLQHLANSFLTKRGLREYFPHGIGHYLGLDVHDVGDVTKPLEPGDVFTIEPGIYIPAESLGIRIEDDFVITDDGCWCLSEDLPRTAQEVEALMREIAE